MYCNNDFKHLFNDFSVIDTGTSDHDLLLIKYNKAKSYSRNKLTRIKYIQSFTTLNVNTFKRKIEDMENLIDASNDINDSYSNIIKNIQHIIKESFPFRELLCKHPSGERCRWITTDFIRACKYRDRLMKTAKNSNLSKDWFEAKKAKRNIRQQSRKLKRDFFSKKMSDFSNNSKKGWKFLNNFLPKKRVISIGMS